MKLKAYFLIGFAMVLQAVQGQAPTWEVQKGIYRYSTSLICAAFDECIETANINDVIGVFDADDVCRGKADFLSFSAGYRAFLTIYGNSTSEDLYFRIYKADVNTIYYAYVSKVDFLAEAIQGSIPSPIQVKYDSSIDVDAGEDQTVYNQTTTKLAATGNTGNNGSWSILYGEGGSFADKNSPVSTFSGKYGETYFLVWSVNDPNCMDEMDHLLVKFINNPLVPVELLFFKGSAQTQGIELEWSTASESVNSGFEIQRSQDAKTWKNIGFVQGNGTSVNRHDYSFLDELPLSGDNYYRLKQIDFDGTFEYSLIVYIEWEEAQKSVQVYPNPTTDNLYYDLADGSTITTVQLVDIFGKVLIYSNLPQRYISLAGLPTGIYTLIIETDKGRQVNSVIKID
ncbi:MAG: T9SS type A sorting domain-containing protein [Saprospiraceae bacterium]|nr:T9SS type A sorting domain-containing protein [Saprospiraceae bacterium]